MGNIEHAAELMLQLMGSPVFLDALAQQTPVSHTAAPHDLGTIAVVFRILQYGKHGILDGAQGGFCQIGGQVHIVVLGEVALHGVHHHVGDTCCCLVGRQREGALRIHDGELGAR